MFISYAECDCKVDPSTTLRLIETTFTDGNCILRLRCPICEDLWNAEVSHSEELGQEERSLSVIDRIMTWRVQRLWRERLVNSSRVDITDVPPSHAVNRASSA
jgi:hypothetical protein